MEFRQACNTLQIRLRNIEDEWFNNHAKETQRCADSGNIDGFYKFERKYTVRHTNTRALFAAQILKRWSKHFSTLFITSRSVQKSALSIIEWKPPLIELNWPPSLKVYEKACEQLHTDKAAGIDGILSEVSKHRGIIDHTKLFQLIVFCWEQGKFPHDFRVAVIIMLYKKKM